jgi:hypothetical protein
VFIRYARCKHENGHNPCPFISSFLLFSFDLYSTRYHLKLILTIHILDRQTMSGQSPRPALKRQSSKVRFSRGDMSPVGTMVSDNDNQGGSTLHQSGPVHPPALINPFRDLNSEAYDINSYPFGASTEIALSQSQDQGQTQFNTQNNGYRGVPTDNPYEDAPGEHDPYTAAPPRMSSRRFPPGNNTTPTQGHRPTLESLLPHNNMQYSSAEISPRNTAGMDSYVMPPVHTSPAPRPASALRPSLVNYYPSPQQRPIHEMEQYADYNNGSPRTRASIPASAPRRLMEQQRPSMQQGSPRDSAQIGSPRNHQSPRPSEQRVPEQYRPGFRRNEYEDRTGLTPGPTYQRSSYFAQDHQEYDQRPSQQPVDERQRYDSQATLTGDEQFQEKKFSADRPSLSRPRASSDTSDREMRRRSTKELEDAEKGTYTVKGGVFSQLLRLTGRNSMRRRQSSRGIAASSRATSCAGDEVPTLKSLGLHPTGSIASTTFGAGELDSEDPRITGVQPRPFNRRASFSDMLFKRDAEDDGVFAGKRKRRASIQLHVAGESPLPD